MIRPILFCLLVVTAQSGCDRGYISATSSPKTWQATSSSSDPSTDQTKTVSIKITGMMCQASCFADVKMLMEKHNAIESIDLVEQQDSNAIDRPIVVVKYTGTLDREATTKAMLGAGFTKVEYDVEL
jgi:hypothetical protein